MFHRFVRHVKEGFLGVRRHIGMALSSASAVTITLLLVGLFLLLSANLAVLSKDIEDSISLVALLNRDVTAEAEISSISDKIHAVHGVAEVDYRTKDQEFDFYNEQYPDMAEFSDLYRDSNPFHDAFLITVTDGGVLKDVKNEIAQIRGIESVMDGGDQTYVLIDILKNVRIVGGVLVLSLCVLAVYLIYNTIKITISSRSDEIWIMRNVGATNGYIRAPFLVEGVIIAVIGSIIPVAAAVGSYLYLYNATGGVLAGVLRMIPPFPFLYYVCLILLGIAVVVGFLGSYISVCKGLRLRR